MLSPDRAIRLLVSAVIFTLVSSLAQAAADPGAEQTSCDTRLARADRLPGLRLQHLGSGQNSLAYYRFGQGSPIVLITGYRAPLSEWNSYFLAELARQHQVIVFDNRGVGQSLSNSTRYQVEDLAQDTSQLIRQLDLHQVTLLGWSMGGMVAQQLALDHPQQISRLVLLSSAAPGPRAIPIPAAAMPVLRGQVDNGFVRAMQLLFPPQAAARAERCFIADMFSPADYASPAIDNALAQRQEQIIQAWMQSRSKPARLQRLLTPTLVLSGLNDAILLNQNSRVLQQLLPHATLTEIEDGGHALMYQIPQRLAQRISDFIADDQAYRSRHKYK